jgi:hypothetical protein
MNAKLTPQQAVRRFVFTIVFATIMVAGLGVLLTPNSVSAHSMAPASQAAPQTISSTVTVTGVQAKIQIMKDYVAFWDSLMAEFKAWQAKVAAIQAAQAEVDAMDVSALSVSTTTLTAPTPAPDADVPAKFLAYDESAPVTPTGQTHLVALDFRIPAPIKQGQLEAGVGQTQLQAQEVGAEVHEGITLTLDQHTEWLVWCADATNVDEPADVSLVHEVTLLDSATLGRLWIQVPFKEEVPLRSDADWIGCGSGDAPGTFWAVRLNH